MSDSVRPHRRQPTRLPHPWDSPGKNTGVGCHFLLRCMKVKVNSPSRVWVLATPPTAAYQAPPSMGFSRQEYWSGVPSLSLKTYNNTNFKNNFYFSSVQSLSHVQLFGTPWTAARQASLSITSRNLLKLMSIESVMPSNHLILCRPLLFLSSIFPSIRVFSNESVLHIRWPKYWSFSFSISPSNEHSGLISFRMDWLDLLAVQGTLKSLLQHHSSKPSVLWRSDFFIVQLSYPYLTTGKTITLTRQTFVGKITSLLFNMLSRLVITLLPRSKRLLTSWLQSPSAVILEPPKIKSDTVSTVSPSICRVFQNVPQFTVTYLFTLVVLCLCCLVAFLQLWQARATL